MTSRSAAERTPTAKLLLNVCRGSKMSNFKIMQEFRVYPKAPRCPYADLLTDMLDRAVIPHLE